VELWAANPLLCSSNNAAKMFAVTRLKWVTEASVTRFYAPTAYPLGCRFRFPLAQS
jgi:hypothetical protein